MKPSTSQALSEIQRKVIATIVASPTARIAYDKTIGDQNQNLAKDFLMNKGFISVQNSGITLTPTGTTVASDEYIIDEMGELTAKGKELAYAEDSDETHDADSDETDDFPRESFSMLKTFID